MSAIITWSTWTKVCMACSPPQGNDSDVLSLDTDAKGREKRKSSFSVTTTADICLLLFVAGVDPYLCLQD